MYKYKFAIKAKIQTEDTKKLNALFKQFGVPGEFAGEADFGTMDIESSDELSQGTLDRIRHEGQRALDNGVNDEDVTVTLGEGRLV